MSDLEERIETLEAHIEELTRTISGLEDDHRDGVNDLNREISNLEETIHELESKQLSFGDAVVDLLTEVSGFNGFNNPVNSIEYRAFMLADKIKREAYTLC